MANSFYVGYLDIDVEFDDVPLDEYFEWCQKISPNNNNKLIESFINKLNNLTGKEKLKLEKHLIENNLILKLKNI